MEAMAKDSFRIVHVEDDDEFAQLTDFSLQSAGFKRSYIRFNSGAAALNYLSSIGPNHAPHAVLLDLHMPGMDGLEVLRWLRKNYPRRDVAVYLLTSSDDPEDMRQAADAGVTKYFLKTGFFDEIVREFDRLIAAYNQKWWEHIQHAEATLAELALMSKYSDDMVLLANAEGRLKWVNESFIRTSGYTLAESLNQKPGRLLRGPASNASAVRMLDQAVHSAVACECRSINYRKNGTPYPVRISLGPVHADGLLEGFLAVEQDLSEKEEPLAATNGR